MVERIYLIALGVWVKLLRLIDSLRALLGGAHSLRFFLADFALKSHYLFKSPYVVSKEYLLAQRAPDPYQYGETPLTTLAKMVRRFAIEPGTQIYELGSGAGRASLWLNLVAKCAVRGIEQVPLFVERAQKVAERLNLEELEFRCESFLDSSYASADLIYLNGSCMQDEEILALCKRLADLKPGSRVITVSHALTDYAPEYFVLTKKERLHFFWGRADVYLQARL